MKYINEAINENLKIERRRKRNCIILLYFEFL
jgi:predicted nucleic acid-binding Zn ribbon protein